MRIFGKIVNAIYVISGIILIIFFLTIWANINYIDVFSNYLKYHITEIGVIGMAIIILGIIYIVNWFDYINETRTISFDNPGGKVKISLKAIEDSITALILREVEGIKSVRVKNYISGKGLETNLYLKLVSGVNIPEITSTIQEITKNYLQDAVGVDRVSNIDTYVTNIVEGKILKEEEETPEQNKEENEQ